MWLGNAICEGSGELTLSEVLLHYRSGRATTTEWQEKMQKEKSNFRKYNEIKTKCLLSLSNLKTFIKITYVRVWFWGKKCLWTTWGCFLKTKTTAWICDLLPEVHMNKWQHLLQWHPAPSSDHRPSPLFPILHMRLWELSLHGAKPLRRAGLGVTSATAGAWRVSSEVASFLLQFTLPVL